MTSVLNLARKGKGLTSPNPMVGAVIVKNNKIISQGWHRRCGGNHAEVIALKEAGLKAQGATLYVNLEPCCHTGKTPPCVDAVIKSKIKKVVIGMKDPNPLTNGKSIAKLRRAGILTQIGVLQKESEQLNEAFIKYIKYQRPFVTAKCAQTLDGKIATATGHSQWITSHKTRQFARALRNEFDAICVGINTVLKDNPRLNAAKKTKHLKKIILDSSLQISPNAKLFQDVNFSDCIVATTTKASPKKIQLLKNKGIHVIVYPKKREGIPLKELFKELAKQKITSILLEGGARTIGNALKERLIDKMHIYIAPKIIGDQKALSSVVGLNTLNINKAIELKNFEIQKLNQEIFITCSPVS